MVTEDLLTEYQDMLTEAADKITEAAQLIDSHAEFITEIIDIDTEYEVYGLLEIVRATRVNACAAWIEETRKRIAEGKT